MHLGAGSPAVDGFTAVPSSEARKRARYARPGDARPLV